MIPYQVAIWVRFLKTDPGGWKGQQFINTTNIVKQQVDQGTGQENSLSGHFDVLQQAFKREKGFVHHRCSLPNQGSPQCQHREQQQPETGLICCGSPIPWQPEGWVPTTVLRSGLQAPLGLPLSSPGVPLGWLKHPRCLLWTQATRWQATLRLSASCPGLLPHSRALGHHRPPSHLRTPEGLCSPPCTVTPVWQAPLCLLSALEPL